MRVALVGCVLVGCGRVAFDDVTDAGDGPAAPLTVTKLEVWDPKTDQVIADVTTPRAVDISAYPSGVTLVATVAGMPGSVELVRGESRNIEVSPPFASGGDNNNTDLKQDDVLVVGKTPIKVTAFELEGATGARGPTRMIDLELTLPLQGPPTVVRVGIIDDSNNNFIEINDGAIISIASSNLAMESDLRVETQPAFVGSVRIDGVGPWAARDGVENFQPYTAMGLGNAFTPTPGTYTVTARAFTLGNGLGEGGATRSVTFQIVP